MKTILIISVNLCFLAAASQTKNSSKKDFVVTENIEMLKARVKEDSQNGIKGISTKKKQAGGNEERNQILEAVDTLPKSNSINKASSKK